MIRKLSTFAATAAIGAASAAVASTNCEKDVCDRPAATTEEPEFNTPQQLNPATFFDTLVNRYRDLRVYRDSSHLVQVIHRPGEPEQRRETDLKCEVEDESLTVSTPRHSPLFDLLGISIPPASTPQLQREQQQYHLWLAPHLVMKFSEQPLREFRAGVKEGFVAAEATEVTVKSRPMIHLELRSGVGASESCDSKFDLYVNPDSMLIERIEGAELLPDGGSCTTTLDITPHEFAAAALDDHVPPAGSPTG